MFDFLTFQILKAGLDRYFGFNKDTNILCIGHSHSALGINAETLENVLHVGVSKYTLAGVNILDRYWMIKHFLKENPNVKIVIYDVDSRLFDSGALSSASYTLFLPYISNPTMDTYLRQQTSWQEYVTCKIVKTSRFRDQTINMAVRGLLDKTENAKPSEFKPENYKGYIEREKSHPIRINQDTVAKFNETMDYLTMKKITVVLAALPVVDILNNIDPGVQDKAMEIFRKTAAQKNNIYFIDFNHEFSKQYSLFYDPRHLNFKGKKIITNRIANYLKKELFNNLSDSNSKSALTTM